MTHTTTTGTTRRLTIAVAALLFAVTTPAAARAEGFISPLIGFNFGGDASCQSVSNCEDKRLNYGVGLGAMNAVFGFEEEFAYARDFFGIRPVLQNSSVLTVMSNFMLVPKVGPIRPYFLAGLGLIKTHTEFTAASLLSTDNNNFGWDVGGGVMVTIVPHVAVRGDIRYFHSFQDLSLAGFALPNSKLDFGRAAGAVVFTF
jgi:opacity protein-like surface antigen